MQMHKTKSSRFARCMTGALALLIVGWTGQAAQAQMAVGVVDEDKLAEGYTKYKAAAEAVNKRAQDMDEQLLSRDLLSDADGGRFDALVVKNNRSAAENTELSNVVKKGAGLRVELMGLIPKVNKTDADNGRIKELQDTATRNGPALRKISDALYAAIKQDQEAIDKEYTDRANKVIEQVAGDKKFNLVLRKRAIVWNAPAIDITDEVLQRLNK